MACIDKCAVEYEHGGINMTTACNRWFLFLVVQKQNLQGNLTCKFPQVVQQHKYGA